MLLLAILFFITAMLYSSVGFGGGSTYLALLLIWGVPYFIFPVIALSCNIIVVSGNCFNYIRAGNLNPKLLIPYLIGSVPCAFVGGSLPIEKKLFDLQQRMVGNKFDRHLARFAKQNKISRLDLRELTEFEFIDINHLSRKGSARLIKYVINSIIQNI